MAFTPMIYISSTSVNCAATYATTTAFLPPTQSDKMHKEEQYVLSTHLDREHIHTHVVVNSTSLDCTKKFRNFKGSAFAVRRIADFLCVENGLSIVADPKPSRGSYGKWQGDTKPPTGRDKLRELIDENVVVGNSLTEFITKLKKAGVEVKYGKQFSFRPPGSERFFRQDTLGEDYSSDAIAERLRGTRTVTRRRSPEEDVFVPFVITRQTSFTLLIDIQKKIQEGKGAAYENWAAVYNLKQMARMLIYLKENGIDSYDELVQKASAASGGYQKKLTRIKEIEPRQKEITELQKQIGTYRKTRETYKAYLRSGRDRSFYDANAADIILHEAAKRHFDKAGYGKNNPLPKVDALKQEWATLESEKKSLYRGYHELKDQRSNLLKAKTMCEEILGIGKDEAERTAERVRNRSNAHDR